MVAKLTNVEKCFRMHSRLLGVDAVGESEGEADGEPEGVLVGVEEGLVVCEAVYVRLLVGALLGVLLTVGGVAISIWKISLFFCPRRKI